MTEALVVVAILGVAVSLAVEIFWRKQLLARLRALEERDMVDVQALSSEALIQDSGVVIQAVNNSLASDGSRVNLPTRVDD